MVSLRRMFGPLHPVCQTLNDKPNKDGVDSTREETLPYDVWFDYYQKIVPALSGVLEIQGVVKMNSPPERRISSDAADGAADPRMRLCEFAELKTKSAYMPE